MLEADLYPAVKAFLEAQGFTVKAEIGPADVMAIRDPDPPVIVELKTALNLPLILQGVARQSLFADVYLAVPHPAKWTHRYRDLTALLRRLGLGLLTVQGETVEAHLDPAPYAPRLNPTRAGRLLREFQRRVGDPNTGGTTRVKRMTAYRQDALRLAAALASRPPTPPPTWPKPSRSPKPAPSSATTITAGSNVSRAASTQSPPRAARKRGRAPHDQSPQRLTVPKACKD